MLVIIIFLALIFNIYFAISRKSVTCFLCATMYFLAITNLYGYCPVEEKIVDQKQMLGLVIDPYDYVSYCSDYAQYRIVTEDDWGWKELNAYNYSIVFEENCTNPTAVYYAPKAIGLIRVNLFPYERVEFHIPPNTTYYFTTP